MNNKDIITFANEQGKDVTLNNQPLHFADNINAENATIAPSKNAFPIEIFPATLRDIITETNQSLKFPTDYIASSLFYAASIAIGNTFCIRVKRGWTERTVFYLAIVGDPSTNKSHPLSFALQPFFDADKKSFKQYEEQKKEYENNLQLSKKEREAQGIELNKPVWQKHIVSDFTPEALLNVHRFCKRGIGVYSDELAGWLNNFGRYHKGNDQQLWLSNWSGKPVYIDRKSSESFFIQRPFISVTGCIQTDLLSKLCEGNRAEDGFLYRILFTFSDDAKKEYLHEAEVSQSTINEWKRIISNLLAIPQAYDGDLIPEPKEITFNPAAWQLFNDWHRKNTDLCNNTQDNKLKAFYGKFDMLFARFALTLELMRYAVYKFPDDNQDESIIVNVCEEATTGAIKLCDYFLKNAKRVYDIISKKQPLSDLSQDKQTIYEALPKVFTTSEGITIAESNGMPRRTFHYFLQQGEFFSKTKHGYYEKNF